MKKVFIAFDVDKEPGRVVGVGESEASATNAANDYYRIHVGADLPVSWHGWFIVEEHKMRSKTFKELAARAQPEEAKGCLLTAYVKRVGCGCEESCDCLPGLEVYVAGNTTKLIGSLNWVFDRLPNDPREHLVLSGNILGKEFTVLTINALWREIKWACFHHYGNAWEGGRVIKEVM